MKLYNEITQTIKRLFSTSSKDYLDSKKALHRQVVARASYGEVLKVGDRIETLTKFISGCSADARKVLLENAKFSRAQLMQDLFVISEVGERRGHGFFVEFGATDGVNLSNTWLLEKQLGWQGVVAEPGRIWHLALRQNRSCIVDTDCVWSHSGMLLNFDEVKDAEFSTISDFSELDGHSSVRNNKKSYQVSSVSLTDLMVRHKAPPAPDYLSIDTEGSELEILGSFDFDRYQFKVITCEHNFTPNREKIRRLLESRWYRRKYEELSRFDDWYVRA